MTEISIDSLRELEKQKHWDEQVKEMDRLCRLHLDVPYSSVSVQGHQLFIKLAPTEKQLPLISPGGIFMPDSEKINQIMVGMVLAMGKYAFKDGVATKWTEGPLCKIGDYVVFFAPETVKFGVNQYNVCYIRDSNVYSVTDDPMLYGSCVLNRFHSGKANKLIFKRADLERHGFKCTDTNLKFIEDFEEKA